MISLGTPFWFPQIKTLWQNVFHDDPIYIQNFLDTFCKDRFPWIYHEENQLYAMLFTVPYTYFHKGTTYQACYFYALATYPDYRNFGYMGQLIRHALQEAKKEGFAFAFLVPAEPSLFAYYEQFGFKTGFHKTSVDFRKPFLLPPSGYALEDTSSDRIWDMYTHSLLYQEGAIRLSKEQHDFFCATYLTQKGHIQLLSKNGQPLGYVLWHMEKTVLTVIETILPSPTLQWVAALCPESQKITAIHYDASFADPLFPMNPHAAGMWHLFISLEDRAPILGRVLS